MGCNNIKGDLEIKQNNVDTLRQEIEKIYDIGIQACEAKDNLGVCNVLNTLRKLLDSRHVGIAAGFSRLYDYCLQFVNNNKFDQARDILYELHQSWNVMAVTSAIVTKDRNVLHVNEIGVN